jgi:hypothetical protein
MLPSLWHTNYYRDIRRPGWRLHRCRKVSRQTEKALGTIQ